MSADIVEWLTSESKKSWQGVIAPKLREAAAEIVRLRGEVCSCPSGDGSLRWPCKAHPPGAIAPAEAKGDFAEAVDCLSELADLMEDVLSGEYKPDSFTTQPARTLLARIKSNAPQPADGGAVAIYGMFRALVDAGGAATVARHGAMPRPEALTDALQRGMIAIESIFHPDRFDAHPPAAQVQDFDRDRDTGRRRKAVETLLAAGWKWQDGEWEAAQVQQEAGPWLIEALRFLGELESVGNLRAGDIARGLRRHAATHPAGDALGAVRPLVDRWRGWIGQYDTGDEAIRDCIDELEAALQHRGDSQEVGRG